jgi:hypothetical protein
MKAKIKSQINVEEIKILLDQFDGQPIECDGFTRIAHTILAAKAIPHEVKAGFIRHKETRQGIDPHFWIKLPTGHLIDYRARMWLGDEPDIPHGVFLPGDFGVAYHGAVIPVGQLDLFTFQVLAGKPLSEVLHPGEWRLILDGAALFVTESNSIEINYRIGDNHE